jgi:hypothetical protein
MKQITILVSCLAYSSKLKMEATYFSETNMKHTELLVSCLASSSNLKMERHVSSKYRLTFNGQHHVVSQKIELYRNTTVRT